MAFPDTVITDNESAGAFLVNKAKAAGLDVSGLQQVAQLQSAVGNLLVSEPGAVTVPAGDVTHGTFGSGSSDTGAYVFPGIVGIGAASTFANLAVSNSVTAVAGVGAAVYTHSTLVASANSDTLVSVYAAPVHTPGAFTGVVATGFRTEAFSVAGFTSPGDPRGIDVGVITGTGATNAVGVRIAPPTGATNNYLIAHTTAATFNVKDSGAITTASTIAMGGALTGATTIAASTSVTVTSASAVALAVGLTGATNPAFTVDSSTGSQVAGFKVTGAVTGGTVALVATDSGADASLTINAKGAGTIGIGSVSTGAVTITPATTITGAATINNTVQLGASASANVITIGGTGYGAGVASVRFNGLTTAAVTNQTGTLLNAPVAGNPTFWMPVSIAGVVKYVPCW